MVVAVRYATRFLCIETREFGAGSLIATDLFVEHYTSRCPHRFRQKCHTKTHFSWTRCARTEWTSKTTRNPPSGSMVSNGAESRELWRDEQRRIRNFAARPFGPGVDPCFEDRDLGGLRSFVPFRRHHRLELLLDAEHQPAEVTLARNDNHPEFAPFNVESNDSRISPPSFRQRCGSRCITS